VKPDQTVQKQLRRLHNACLYNDGARDERIPGPANECEDANGVIEMSLNI
jgi:hypothetical protein